MPMSKNRPDDQPQTLYDLLQVSPRAKAEVIPAAYHVLARSYHPDVSRHPHSAQLMRRLNAAYDVLSDPVRRADYDVHCGRPARALGGNGRAASGKRAARSPRRDPPARRRAEPLLEQRTM